MGLGVVLSTCPENLTVMLFIQQVLSIPFSQIVGGPKRGFIRVALVAAVRSPQLIGEIGSWYTDAVIAPGIDHHVGVFVHVTFGTIGSLLGGIMEMVFPGAIF
jgi:hypothetical protein